MQRWLVRITVAAGFAVVVISLAIRTQMESSPSAAASRLDLPVGVPMNRAVPPDTLVGADGKPGSLAALRGRWLALAPVATRCHESCPLTTAALLRLRALMGAAGAGRRFAIAEVSVDPWRDSPARLRAHQRETGERLPLFTGDLAQLHRFWRFFGVGFHRVPGDVAHTEAIFLLDPSGRERVAIAGAPGAWRPRAVAADLRLLMGLRAPLPGDAGPADRRKAATRLLDGDRLDARLRSLRGRPAVLNAWASWCPPCREELPLFAAAATRFGRRVAFLGADVEDDAANARRLLAEIPLGYPSYATTLDALRSLGPTPGTPFTLFIDGEGAVVGNHIGAYRSQEELDADVSSLLRG
jgi:cytochrome oxidase Cu insertion factor (SCO1/SenC/PrrC family)/thiol-disulfide isomerase/thioredoxin